MVFYKVDDFALSAYISNAPTISGLAMPGGDVIVNLSKFVQLTVTIKHF
jgi:hypothetical protein